jgi:hypothetical protein
MSRGAATSSVAVFELAVGHDDEGVAVRIGLNRAVTHRGDAGRR